MTTENNKKAEMNPAQWMDKAVRSLYLQLPSEVADDVREKWEAAKEFLSLPATPIEGEIKSKEVPKEIEDKIYDKADHEWPLADPGLVTMACKGAFVEGGKFGYLLASQFTASKEKEYREALENIIKSWDEKTHEREQLKHFDGLDYWSPAASMVESKVIAAARKALNK